MLFFSKSPCGYTSKRSYSEITTTFEDFMVKRNPIEAITNFLFRSFIKGVDK